MLDGNRPPAPQLPPASGADADEAFARLHVSPFDSELLKVVVPAAVLPKARNISFHTIQTFPENRYGFIELPAADAEKVQRKFHGSTLRGAKMRVQKARPEKIVDPLAEEEPVKKRKKRSTDEDGATKKRKRDHNTVEGVLLPDGRKVKRGWTVTADEVRKEKRKSKSKDKDKANTKSRNIVKSKYTEKEECLMKTVPPLNAPTVPDSKPKKKKKGSSKREVVVHEFEHTTKFPSFLKTYSTTGPTATTNPKTTTPEALSGLILSNATTGVEVRPEAKPEVKAESTASSDSDSSDSDSSDSDSSDSDSSDSDEEEQAAKTESKSDSESSDEDGDDDSDSDSETASDTSDSSEDVAVSSTESAQPSPPDSTKNLSIQIPSTPAPPVPSEVHPLEALYKKTKDESTTAAAEPFSFFGGGSDEEDEDAHQQSSQPPMTPFTRRDLEQRTIRSAAPTPDTAHPARRVFWAPNGEDSLDEQDEPESPVRRPLDNNAEPGKEDAGPTGGDFQSWFYDNRREINRSWMDRRRTAKKEKRQRDNRAKGK